MKNFIHSIAGKIILGVLALIILGAGTLACIVAFNAKFQDVTIELGEPMPEQSRFFTPFTIDAMAQLVSGAEEADLTKTGSYPITFTHGLQEETVQLIVVDTVAPTATFQDVAATIDAILKPEDFVVDAFDLSGVTITFAKPLDEPDNYGETTVDIVVTDGNGNSITQNCRIRYRWMFETVFVEYGQELTKAALLLDPAKDSDLIDQADIDRINAGGVGTYTVTSSEGDLTHQCTVTVADTTGPELKLQEVTVHPGETVSLEDFFLSATDLSGDVQVKLVTSLNTADVGEFTVTVEATDIYGNVTAVDTVLKVVKDVAGPVFAGMTEISVVKNDEVDFMAGVTAYDAKDGYVTVSVDTSRVKLNAAGTYYAVYTATDSNGNTTTYRRKVIVKHDAADLENLIFATASKLSDHPADICRWLKNNIYYLSNVWAEDDPVWHGLTAKTGNCYVQACCLEALLDAKGYDARLIWTTDKSHYWVIVNYNGQWRHIDSTPGPNHENIVLVTDYIRAAQLQGRNWDRSQWPAAN